MLDVGGCFPLSNKFFYRDFGILRAFEKRLNEQTENKKEDQQESTE